MRWFFAVPAGPAETWKARARAAAEQERPDRDEPSPEMSLAIAAAIDRDYASCSTHERDAATVRVDSPSVGG